MNTEQKKIIIAVTGASGTLYARLLLQVLSDISQIKEIAVIVSKMGRAVANYENVALHGPNDDPRINVYDNEDFFAAPASGSARYDSMVIIPCSMGTVGRIASGVSTDLISRAADVILKERRQLIVVPRENPLSIIHLRNLTTLAECGTVVMPASPSFYSLPNDMEGLCHTVIDRVVDQLGLPAETYRWLSKPDNG